MGALGNVKDLYFDGELETSIALGGQVAGRIESIAPVREVIEEILDEFHRVIADLGRHLEGR
jgi:enoyl-[acyl-carrier protein] reductase II